MQHAKPSDLVTEREEAIELAQEVVAAWAACNAANRSVVAKAEVDTATADLIQYLLTHFDGEVDPTQVRQMFAAGIYRLSLEGLDSVPEPMVPIAVMREVLHTHKVMFNHRNVSNWREFVGRFGKFIMGA